MCLRMGGTIYSTPTMDDGSPLPGIGRASSFDGNNAELACQHRLLAAGVSPELCAKVRQSKLEFRDVQAIQQPEALDALYLYAALLGDDQALQVLGEHAHVYNRSLPTTEAHNFAACTTNTKGIGGHTFSALYIRAMAENPTIATKHFEDLMVSVSPSFIQDPRSGGVWESYINNNHTRALCATLQVMMRERDESAKIRVVNAVDGLLQRSSPPEGEDTTALAALQAAFQEVKREHIEMQGKLDTALKYAIERGDDVSVQILVQHGATPSEAMSTLAKNGNNRPEGVHYFLGLYLDALRAKRIDATTPLEWLEVKEMPIA